MGFQDEYIKLRKKRLGSDGQGESNTGGMLYQNKTLPQKDIAPVYTSPKKSEFDDGYQFGDVAKTVAGKAKDWGILSDKNAFSDGYQFGDVMKSAYASTADLGISVFEGVGGLAEGIADLAGYGIAGVSDLLGADDFADALKESVKNNVVQGWGEGLRKPGDIETNSVFGETTRSFGQGLGYAIALVGTGGAGSAAGLSSAGVTALTTGVTGLSAMGSGMSEAYMGNATDDEAFTYGVINGVVNAGSELIFGGLGKSVNALGIGRGISSLDDIFAKKLTEKISNHFVKTVIQYGVKASAEGFEEVIAGVGQAAGKKLTYMSDEDLGQLIKDEKLLEQFAMGMAISGVMQLPGAVSSIKSGNDFITGLSDAEQSVVDAVADERIAEKENGGQKLTNKQKNEIREQVERDMDRGYISVDDIERILGGEEYTKYQNEVNRQQDLDKELKELRSMKSGEMTDIQHERMAELKAMKPNTEMLDTLKFALDEKLRKALSSGGRFIESYNERARRGQAFEADLSQYEGAQQETIKRAVESGILNNTNRTHEFVDMVAKISADKGVLFDFTNNAKLKESGFAVEGATVNGYFDKKTNTVGVNIDSAKAYDTVVGHEVTHVLGGTELYDELQKAVFEYAKTKGEYDSRRQALAKLYAEKDIDSEMTADLVGDYLFTDENFVKNLSVQHRNVFQKIYDEIKYLYKLATAGSKEAREIEKVKRAFDKAYREQGAKADVKSEDFYDAKTKHSLTVKDPETLDFLNNQETITTYKTMQLVDGKLYPPMAARTDGKYEDASELGVWEQATEHPELIKSGNKFKLDKGKGQGSIEAAYNPYMHSSNLVLNDQFSGAYKRDNLVTVECEVPVSEITSGYHAEFAKDSVGWHPWHTGTVAGQLRQARGTERQVFLSRWIKPVRIVPDSEVAAMYKELLDGTDVEVPDNVVTPSLLNELKKAGVKIKDSGRVKYSLSDSDGKRLSKGQQEYFKDSKMRDENGNLKVMYHGSQYAGFHVFDPAHSDDDTSLFFVDRNDVAASYSGTSETYEAQTIRNAEDMNKFIESIGVEGYEVVEKDGKFTLLYEGDRVAASDSAKGIYKEFCWYEGVGEGDANYKVYLNLTNPLEIDAKGRPWNKIDAEFSQEVYDKYQSLTAEEKDALIDLAGWEDFRMFNSELQDAAHPVAHGDSYIRNLATAYYKMGEDCNIYDLFSVAADNFSEESMRENARQYLKTRDYAQRAKEQGYDGVIFKNIVDNGGYSNGSEGASTVAIAFDSNQIKSVANENPTGDPDIRYSLTEYTAEEKKAHNDAVLEHFGRTFKWAETGYVLLDGARLDLSGKHDGAPGGYRTVDHRDITEALGYDYGGGEYSGSLIQFMSEGNIRIVPEIGGINLSVKPTKAQEQALSDYISRNRGEVVLDIDDLNGSTVVSVEYPRGTYYKKVLDDIREWFDNGKRPTGDPDIRYSLSEDSEGRELSPAVKNRFGNSKVVDENGSLKVVYHGTAAGEFSIFDKSKGSVEGDFGSGFYFTDSQLDVSEHYEGGGPDFDNKVARRAEQIEAEEDIDYDEAEERARAELYKGGHKFEVYLNIENPAIVGETILFEPDSYYSQYDQEDYDSGEDYYGEVDQLVADDIDGIIWDIERNVDIYSTDGIADVLWEAFNEGGIELETLKTQINNLYLEDSNGNLVGNEVTRQIVESLGYDGIIDPTVSTKWNMDMEPDTTHYIVFKPNQIKAVTNQSPTDNPDIHKSLSADGEAPGKGRFFGKDIRLDVAPVAEDSSNATTTEQVTPEPIAPVAPETVADAPTLLYLYDEQAHLQEQLLATQDEEAAMPLMQRYHEVTEQIRQLEAEEQAIQSEWLASLGDADVPPEVEAPYYESYESDHNLIDDPFKKRDIKDVGDRKVKAYMYENPEVKPFFQQEAEVLLGELSRTTKGERYYTETPDGRPGEYGAESYGYWTGTSRDTSPDIAYLLDTLGYSYDQIENGLKAIIEDNGAENNACSKRIEFILHDRLADGYSAWDAGVAVPPNQDYINLINEKQIMEYSEEARKQFFEVADQYAPPAEDIAPTAKAAENVEPIKTEPIKSEPSMKRATEERKTEGKIAKVLTEEPQTEKKGKNAWSMFKNLVLDRGMVFEDWSLKTGNRELQARWNAIRYAESKAQKLIGEGNEMVSSLQSIRQTVENSGKTEDFYYYLYHKHNVDRMSLEAKAAPTIGALRAKFGHLTEAQVKAIAAKKITDTTTERTAQTIREAKEYLNAIETKNMPVFGDDVTADVSMARVAEYERANPEFKEWAQDVYGYMNYLREMLVDAGVISNDTARLWAEMYPNYVPIRRAGKDGLSITVPLDTGRTGINAPIKGATGGNSDILPLFDTMALRTEQTYRAIAKNRFGVELKDTLGTTIDSKAQGVDDTIESIDNHDELLKEGKNGASPTFTVFENGERVEFEITEEMYDAMKPTSKELAYTNKALNTAGNVFRGLLTEYNPVFMTTNAAKDVQDILINSQHPARTYAAIPKAITQMAKGGHWCKEYLANGGEQNTYFDGESKTFKAEDEGWKKVVGMPLRGISYMNNAIERVPRLAEYIASREAGQSIDVSMLDAARVTTNFAAGGDLTKALNRNGFTFLNASTQGAVQQVRNIREAKANGLKGWVQLAARVAVAGLPALLLNNLLWDDDEDYEELADYVKQNYYVVAKFGDGQFVRIPKGRTVAVIQNAFEQVNNALTGDDEVDLQSFLELAISNLAPNNPLENNILAPIVQVANNETWYGEDLVPTRLQDLPAAEQYDESTDAISRWLGEKLNYSPYKINYLLNQYSGGVGDVILPMLTPEAESGDNSFVGNIIAPFKDKFTTDSTMKNQNVSDFYDTVDELTKNAKSAKATDEDVLKYKYMNSVNAELSELYKQKREIQNSDLPDAEKYEAVRDIQKQINSLASESLETYGNVYINDGYATVGDRHYRLKDGEWQKISDDQLEKQNEVVDGLGIDPSEYWANKSEYDFAYEYPERYAVAKSVGGYEQYKTYSSELYDIKADKDENGKSITGSRKEKVIDYINNLDADYGEKIILFKSEYNADDTYNEEIIDYLNSREDISYEEMVSILTELGFTVKNGHVYWD